MDLELATEAMMAMLSRYGAVWSSDGDHLQDMVTEILEAVAELADDYPSGDDKARATLQAYRDTGMATP